VIEHEGINFEIYDVDLFNEVIRDDCYSVKSWLPETRPFCLDLGANLGTFALWAASLGCDVLAIEPHPESYAALLRNISLNPKLLGKIIPWNIAVALENKPWRLRFARRDGFPMFGTNVLCNSTLDYDGFVEPWETIDIRCRTFSDILATALDSDLGSRVPEGWNSFLKVDIEQSDREFMGVQPADLSRFKRVSFEKHLMDLPYGKLLKDAGFQVSDVGRYIRGIKS